MKKIKIGFLPLYVKLYDDVDVDRKPLELFYEEIATRFQEEYGFEVLKTPVCRLKEEFAAAVRAYEEQSADVIVTLHIAYSPSLESAEVLCGTELPIVILDTTESFVFSPETNPDALMLNHGIHGVMDMCNLLKKGKKKYAIAAGHTSGDVLKRTADLVRAATAARALHGSKTGLIGGRFPGMGDFLIEEEKAKSRFGIEILHADNAELKSLAESVTEAEIAVEKNVYTEKYVCAGGMGEELLSLSVRACLAVRKWLEKHELDAFSLNFLDINKENLSTVPFVECCEAMRRGIGYAGECDGLTASFVGAISKGFEQNSFAEIFCPDWKDDRLFISHMGEMNYAVADGKPVLSPCEFIYTDADDCYKGYARFKGGKAVFCNVFNTGDEEWKLLLSDIEMQTVEMDTFAQSIRGWFKPTGSSVPAFLEAISEAGGTHHSFIVYDVDVKALKYFGELLNLKVQVI